MELSFNLGRERHGWVSALSIGGIGVGDWNTYLPVCVGWYTRVGTFVSGRVIG